MYLRENELASSQQEISRKKRFFNVQDAGSITTVFGVSLIVEVWIQGLSPASGSACLERLTGCQMPDGDEARRPWRREAADLVKLLHLQGAIGGAWVDRGPWNPRQCTCIKYKVRARGTSMHVNPGNGRRSAAPTVEPFLDAANDKYAQSRTPNPKTLKHNPLSALPFVMCAARPQHRQQ